MLPRLARGEVAVKNGSESALDVADVRVVEDDHTGIAGINADGHFMPPCRIGAGGEPSLRLQVSYAQARRFGFAVGVLFGAPVETPGAISAGLLGPLFMFEGLQAARERREGGGVSCAPTVDAQTQIHCPDTPARRHPYSRPAGCPP